MALLNYNFVSVSFFKITFIFLSSKSTLVLPLGCIKASKTSTPVIPSFIIQLGKFSNLRQRTVWTKFQKASELLVLKQKMKLSFFLRFGNHCYKSIWNQSYVRTSHVI